MGEMACYSVLFEQIRNMILKQVKHTLFKFQTNQVHPLNHRIETVFVKWQDHVYEFEIMIWNHVSDSGKSNAPMVLSPVSVVIHLKFTHMKYCLLLSHQEHHVHIAIIQD